MEHYHIYIYMYKGQERCWLSGRLFVAPRDKKSMCSYMYQAQRFQLIYTQDLVFGIDTHNDAANTDTPIQILNFVINATEQVMRLHDTGG